MQSFSDIAAKKAAEIERPPLPPAGTYRWQVTKLPTQRKSKDEMWEFVEFPVIAMEAMDNVDVDSYKGEISKISSTLSFIFDRNDTTKFEQTLYNYRMFLERSLGIDLGKMSIAEATNAAVGGQFLADLNHEINSETGDSFARIARKTAPVK